jgi:hypothetical protein
MTMTIVKTAEDRRDHHGSGSIVCGSAVISRAGGIDDTAAENHDQSHQENTHEVLRLKRSGIN